MIRMLGLLLPMVSLLAQTKPTIAVFPFENKSASVQEAWMIYGLSNLISESMQATGALSPIAMDNVHQAHIDGDIHPQSLFDGKITPTFIKYHLDWNAGYSLLGTYEFAGDSVRLSFRFCILHRKAFTPVETVSGRYAEFTEFYRTFNRLMEAVYAHMILQTDLAVARPAIELSHARSRELIADLDGLRSYVKSWMTWHYYEDGQAALTAGRLDEAIRYFQTAEATDESHTLNIRAGLANAFVRRGNVQFDKREWEGAARDYENALNADPRNGAAYYDLGNVHKEQGAYEKAIGLYRKAVDVDAGNFEAWINTGYACTALGRHGEALTAYRNALSINDSSALAHYYAGVAYDFSNDSAGAKKEYERALVLDPSMASAHLNLGIILRRQNDLAGARRRYMSAITYDANNALAHRNLGILLMKDKKEAAQALWHLQRTIELEPGQPDADAIRKNIETLKKKTKKK